MVPAPVVAKGAKARGSGSEVTRRSRRHGGTQSPDFWIGREERGMLLTMGKREMELPSRYLGELREANEILSDVTALRERMAEEAYLLIRGLFERERVLEARRQILEVLTREGALDPDRPLMDAVAAPGQHGGFRAGQNG